MKTPLADKLVGLGLVIAGLAFIALTHPSDGILLLAGLVVLGGISTIVNAQALATIVNAAEKAAGGPILPLGSSASSPPNGAEATDQANGRAK